MHIVSALSSLALSHKGGGSLCNAVTRHIAKRFYINAKGVGCYRYCSKWGYDRTYHHLCRAHHTTLQTYWRSYSASFLQYLYCWTIRRGRILRKAQILVYHRHVICHAYHGDEVGHHCSERSTFYTHSAGENKEVVEHHIKATHQHHQHTWCLDVARAAQASCSKAVEHYQGHTATEY